MLKKLTQTGDTILEAMVAIAAVSAVLAAAYVSSNRSLQASHQSQERGEATRIAESQAEQLKVLARDDTSGVFDSTSAYCVAFTGPNADKKHSFGSMGPFAVPTTLENDNFASYPTECKFSNYNVAIKYDPPVPADRLNDSFTVLVRWTRLGGENDEIQMKYRLHQ
jgi:type II secretory pathway pseudopilin PulG